MNTILQKRIEEAAEQYAYTNWENDDYHEGAEEGMPFDPIGYLEKCFKKAATFALQNQWISVEEAMPKSNENVFVMNEYGGYDYAHYDYNNKIWRMSSGGNADESDEIYSTITHWMEIPKNK